MDVRTFIRVQLENRIFGFLSQCTETSINCRNLHIPKGTYPIKWRKWIILGWSSRSLALNQGFLLIYTTARRSFTCARSTTIFTDQYYREARW